MLKKMLTCGGVIAFILFPMMAHAEEVIRYRFDAKGRLIEVSRSGSVNSGVKTIYSADKAGNRSKVKTSGAT